MIFKYDTKKINNKHYIVTSRLISEKGKPDNILEFEKPFTKEMVDENFKLQWRVERQDGKTVFIKDPIPLNDTELKAKRNKKIREEIHKNYPTDDEIKLINEAIKNLAEVGHLPDDYNTYRLKVESIKRGIKDGIR